MTLNATSIVRLLNLNKRVYYSSRALLFLFSALVLVPLVIHIIIIKYHHSFLTEYASDNLVSASQVNFQLRKGLNTLNTSERLCDEEDLKSLRAILDKYLYIGDIGRIKDGELLCTIKLGLLLEPIQLDKPDVISDDGRMLWNSQDKQRLNEKNPPYFGKNNTIVYLAPLYLKDFELYSFTNMKRFGGMLFSTEFDYVYNVFGDVSIKLLNQAKSNEVTIFDYLPLPGRIMSYKKCIVDAQICALVVNRELGLYRLDSTSLLLVALASIFVGAFSVIIFGHYQSGLKLFIKKLKRAIRKGHITAEYQPKLRLSDKKIIGVEALARWNDPVIGQIPPDIFISAAEQMGLINNLTKQFILKVFEDMHSHLEENSDFSVSINLSSEILIDEDFISFIHSAIEQYRFEQSQIILEITERTSSDNSEMICYSQQLSKAGYKISLDDFGTGYSNLEWLSTLEPYEIKIDKMFTQSINTNSVKNVSLQGILKMIELIDVVVVFEGIETEEQFQYVREKAPNAIGQGWLFYRSLSKDELMLLL